MFAHNEFMCFVWIWEQTAIISLNNINLSVFITKADSVYCAELNPICHSLALLRAHHILHVSRVRDKGSNSDSGTWRLAVHCRRSATKYQSHPDWSSYSNRRLLHPWRWYQYVAPKPRQPPPRCTPKHQIKNMTSTPPMRKPENSHKPKDKCRGKVHLQQATKVQRWSRGIPILFH